MIKVYIASPYTVGDKEKNVQRQIETATELIDLGYNPFWPLSSHYLHEYKHNSYETWMEIDYDWLSVCDVLLRLPGESYGAEMEIEYALEHDIPVFYSIEALNGWVERNNIDTSASDFKNILFCHSKYVWHWAENVVLSWNTGRRRGLTKAEYDSAKKILAYKKISEYNA